MKTYIVKASWRSTAKLLKVQAKDRNEALEKASRRRDIEGYLDLKVTSWRT
jgi:hypothetical protein